MTLGLHGSISVTGLVTVYQGGIYHDRLGTARFLNGITSNQTATVAVPSAAVTQAIDVAITAALDAADARDVVKSITKRRRVR